MEKGRGWREGEIDIRYGPLWDVKPHLLKTKREKDDRNRHTKEKRQTKEEDR